METHDDAIGKAKEALQALSKNQQVRWLAVVRAVELASETVQDCAQQGESEAMVHAQRAWLGRPQEPMTPLEALKAVAADFFEEALDVWRGSGSGPSPGRSVLLTNVEAMSDALGLPLDDRSRDWILETDLGAAEQFLLHLCSNRSLPEGTPTNQVGAAPGADDMIGPAAELVASLDYESRCRWIARVYRVSFADASDLATRMREQLARGAAARAR